MAGRGPQSLPGMQRPREQERRHPPLRVGAAGPAPVARAAAALQDALARRAEQSAAVGLARADAAALDLAAAAPAVARGRPGGERGLSLAVRPAVPPVVVAAARGARGLGLRCGRWGCWSRCWRSCLWRSVLYEPRREQGLASSANLAAVRALLALGGVDARGATRLLGESRRRARIGELARGVLVLRTRTVVAGMRVYSRLVVVGGRSNASPRGPMPLDARDGHAAVSCGENARWPSDRRRRARARGVLCYRRGEPCGDRALGAR